MDFEKNFDKVTCFYQFENEIELNVNFYYRFKIFFICFFLFVLIEFFSMSI